jgi:hypothetical protein
MHLPGMDSILKPQLNSSLILALHGQPLHGEELTSLGGVLGHFICNRLWLRSSERQAPECHSRCPTSAGNYPARRICLIKRQR